MAWVSASMPVAAVRDAGMPLCSSASFTATLGVTRQSMMHIFTFRAVSVIMQNRVISDAVPAVVLMASSGGTSVCSLLTPS